MIRMSGFGQQQLDDQRRGIQRPGRIEENVADNADERKVVTGTGVEAAFKVFGHGKDSRSDIDGKQKRGEEDHDEYADKVVIENGQPRRIGISGLSDERSAGDARGKERQPDAPPGHRAAGQEVGFRVSAPPVAQCPPYDTQNADRYNGNIHDRKAHGHSGFTFVSNRKLRPGISTR